MKRIPTTEWKTGEETVDDIQVSYIAKSVAYGDYYGICMFVGRRADTPTPVEFTYYFELDIDPAKAMTIWFRKRGHNVAGFSDLLDPQSAKAGIFVLSLPNLLPFPKDQYTLNLFDAHIKSDTVMFGYTAQDGTKKEVRFSLAGFKERYLEQFV